MKRARVLSILVILTLALVSIAIPGARPSSVLGSQAGFASPTASATTSCTIWRQEAGFGDAASETCTKSNPWWTVWDTCDITPVHAERSNLPWPHDRQLDFLPWIVASSDTVTLRGYLFYGNRPLAVGGHFDRDEMNAKVLWEFGEQVELHSITGVNLWDTSQTTTIPFSVANSNDAISYWFPSIMDFPTGGCWEATFVGTTENDRQFSAIVTFIVIDK